MLTSRQQVRTLGRDDLSAFLELAERDPVVNVFADYRARTTNLEPRWLGGEVWGRFTDGELTAACHVGANLVPVECTLEDVGAFAERALQGGRTATTIVGLEQLWPLVVPGGIVAFDEYGIPPWEGEAKAVDEFFAGQSIELKRFDWCSNPGAYVVKR